MRARKFSHPEYWADSAPASLDSLNSYLTRFFRHSFSSVTGTVFRHSSFVRDFRDFPARPARRPSSGSSSGSSFGHAPNSRIGFGHF
ncbi:hypothetical protein V6S75_24050 [Burkholderia pseudomallei]|uniref:hypothetical protein n=1 Tax=Burkholderia pseudomallei TaxID=28450 RepID=UPI0009B23A21|nr:hypothetical protein [Burkholderia pseudomallei]MBF4019339.1 hypothetical protein [Burkholderia pseudomallei]MBO2981837.1 hypothetical protein [Burkholderia pseudomallei]MBO3048107.1 hypothetical protein [Burkholderia pseudomallei]MBO7806367.1 hypothetical protein [Burkholderia pseudomallei]MBO7866279.1 hypothetical protein [Burkholderia pseudomallei]